MRCEVDLLVVWGSWLRRVFALSMGSWMERFLILAVGGGCDRGQFIVEVRGSASVVVWREAVRAPTQSC